MKKVLLLTENFPPIEGGSGRWFWELYSRLPKDKIVVCTHHFDEGFAFDKTHNIPVIRFPLHSPEWGFKSISGLRFYIACVRKLLKIIKEYEIEEIHCGRVIHEGVTAWIVSMLTGTQFRCYVHGEDVETAATSREQSFLVRRVCKSARQLICNSYNSRNLVVSLGFENDDKCSVLHPGVDVERFKPGPPDHEFRNEMGWSNRKILLTVGRLQQRKGQDYLIKAMPDLIEATPDLLYAVVGRGECEETLKNLIAELKLENHVKLYTDLNDEYLIKCYQQCDFFILPNRTIDNDIEGFGMVLVEAQACGKLVIAGNSGGTAETMVIGESGEIIDCSNPEKISKELAPLLNCSKLSSYGDKGVEHVRKNLIWDTHVKNALEIFRR